MDFFLLDLFISDDSRRLLPPHKQASVDLVPLQAAIWSSMPTPPS